MHQVAEVTQVQIDPETEVKVQALKFMAKTPSSSDSRHSGLGHGELLLDFGIRGQNFEACHKRKRKMGARWASTVACLVLNFFCWSCCFGRTDTDTAGQVLAWRSLLR